MKKIKLLPSLFIVSLPACIAPCTLTSCGDGFKLKDITNIFEPTFKQYQGTPETTDDIISAYKSFAEKNWDDFLADMEWSTKQNWMSFLDWSNTVFNVYYSEGGSKVGEFRFDGDLVSLKFGMTKPTFGEVDIRSPGSEKTQKFATASFKMRTVVEAKVTTEDWNDGGIYTDHHIFFDCTTDIKNILMHAYYAQRNDKTLINKARREKPGMYSSSWIITPHTDSPTNLHYQYDLQEYCISYSATMSDEIVRHYPDGRKDRYTDAGTYSGDIDTPNEIDTICAYKSYDWDGEIEQINENEIPDVLVNYFSPSTGWRNWFNQRPEAWIANAIVPDMFTHYFRQDLQPEERKEDLGYLELTESPTASFLYGYWNNEPGQETVENEYPAFGWTYQLTLDPESLRSMTLDSVTYQLGQTNSAGKFVPFNEPLILDELGDQTGVAHYWHPEGEQNIKMKIPEKPLANKPRRVSSKISLPITFIMQNADQYVTSEEAKSGQRNIISSLQFELPKDTAIQYTVGYSIKGEKQDDLVIEIPIKDANRVITLSKYASK